MPFLQEPSANYGGKLGGHGIFFNTECHSSINGKVQRIAKTTKGAAVLGPFVERCIDWLIENYDPPQEALDPERFKHWRDTVFPYGGADNFLDYLVELNILKAQSINA